MCIGTTSWAFPSLCPATSLAIASFSTAAMTRWSRRSEAKVTGTLQLHGNDSYGYRIEKDGKSVIYTTDSEHKPQDKAEMERVAKFFGGADLVIFDAMYSLADTVSVKEDWGHSSNIMGVELCQMGGVKKLCLFHHEPVYDDKRLEGIFNETLRFEEITRADKKLDV